MTRLARCGLWWGVPALLAACSPAHDWRDVRPAATQAALQFPCRPVAQQRSLPLAGSPVELTLLACTAGGQTWALAHADVADPARVAAALTELRESTLAKLNAGRAARALPLDVPGATPNVQAGRLRSDPPAAASAGAAALQVEIAVFAHGTRVFQASVLGEQVPAEQADLFFASIGFRP